ncbi:MAG TPA: nuclear transport factor 2 family protein [Vicinamibacterales bacterium]|nr:nuclear transport factor 2 family protein [Vicinamibacterales bacterium]
MHPILIVTLAFAQPAVATDAGKELYRLEAVWNEAHVKGDAETLDTLWANDLIVTIASMPVLRKTEALAMVRSNRMPFSRYETSDLNVKHFGDSALVTGRLQRERTMNGKPVADDWRFTKVYVLNQGRWQVVAWHASPAAP